MQGDLSYSGEQSVISQKPPLPLQIKYNKTAHWQDWSGVHSLGHTCVLVMRQI